MRTIALAVGVVLAVAAGAASAQEAADAPTEPPTLRLPVGARARVQTVAAPGAWIRGSLTGAEAESVGLLPEGAPPLPGSELRLPTKTLARFEIHTGRKSRWLPGLLVGAAAGLALGLTWEVDPERCEFDDDYMCSRGEALAASLLVLGGAGAGIGALVKTDVWTPVALDALGPATGDGPRVRPQVRASAAGVALGVSVRF